MRLEGQVLKSNMAVESADGVIKRACELGRQESGVLTEKSSTADPPNPLLGLLW